MAAEPTSPPGTMTAIVTTGTGGYDRLSVQTVPVPTPKPDEVLIKVLAAGVNNTDINTRLGWYSASVADGTNSTDDSADQPARADGGWNETTPFPFIQGTDCCGEIVATGAQVKTTRLGERVLIRACMRPLGFDSFDNLWLGSDFDGAFAQYCIAPSRDVFAVHCDWSDAELATIPCAYATAENMVHRAQVTADMTVLVPGASGGVGSALVQLLNRRGAHVVAITSASKAADIAALGAQQVLTRDQDVLSTLGAESVDVVIDNVAGVGFPAMLKVLKRGGSYVSSGAIAGPMLSLDLRDIYLKDLRLIGCTAWDAPVFPNLIGYIERGEIKPLLAATYPLVEIAQAQRDFLEKRHIGKFALIP